MNKPRNLATPWLFGLLGDRPTQLSASMHNAGFRALALPYSYSAFDTEDTEGGISAMWVLGIRGLSLTIPHKELAMDLVSEVDAVAQRTGSINTVINDGSCLRGYNTDVYGVEQALHEKNFSAKGKRVLLLGAGGAARAGIVALQQLGVSQIVITNRGEQRASMLADEFQIDQLPWDELSPNLSFDLLLNSTPIGSAISPAEASQELLRRLELKNFAVVFDMVTRDTPLIAQALKSGSCVIPGQRMLLYQALEQFRLFTGQEPPRVVMEDALLACLNK